MVYATELPSIDISVIPTLNADQAMQMRKYASIICHVRAYSLADARCRELGLGERIDREAAERDARLAVIMDELWAEMDTNEKET